MLGRFFAPYGGKLWEAPGLLTELHAETFDLLAYGQALEEHAAGIFRDYDAGRVTAEDALARVRAVLWGDGGKKRAGAARAGHQRGLDALGSLSARG